MRKTVRIWTEGGRLVEGIFEVSECCHGEVDFTEGTSCKECDKPCQVVKVEYVYCHGCSESGGADRAIYHAAPVCK